MRKLFLSWLFILCTSSVFAGEGMWLPFLLQQLNEKEMISMGLKIKAEDIYSVADGSLKDAIVIFGGGCTGELISSQGLVLTNHHCGYGSVNALSTVQNDYLTNGFFAKNMQEEIPCAGLSVTFIRKIDEVSNEILFGTENLDSKKTDSLIDINSKKMIAEAEKKSGLKCVIKSFFNGNAYYIFYTEKFEDVRLVAFPPNGIGKFGGDTDNWAWPRHTGDFGLFRIYANKENKASVYDKNNVPYQPKRHLKINIGGLQENDFAMVYGFPGRTNEYLTSDGVNEVMNILDPARIKIRAKRLQIIESAMKASKENFIRYASKQAGIANYYKKWQGELLGLQVNDAVNKKKNEEDKFLYWLNSDPFRQEKYGSILNDISGLYQSQKESQLQYTYITECLFAPDFYKFAALGEEIIDSMRSTPHWRNYDWGKKLYAKLQSIDLETDKQIALALFKMYENEFTSDKSIRQDGIDDAYKNSLFSDTLKLYQLLSGSDTSIIIQQLQEDLAQQTRNFINKQYKETVDIIKPQQSSLNEKYKLYMAALMEQSKTDLYPDANSTLRLSYGKIQGVAPQDGLQYSFYTTLGGAVRKRNTDVEEFDMPQRLVDLYYAKDFGMYAIEHNGQKEVPLAFLSSLHTTGGNSGSPVLNAYGELIGTNFDRIWEGTMSDILYDINLCRNITVDIRYTLFIIDKFGQSSWIIDELDLVKQRH